MKNTFSDRRVQLCPQVPSLHIACRSPRSTTLCMLINNIMYADAVKTPYTQK